MERGDKDKGTEESDQKAFNETLKRMLKTPPKPHEESRKPRTSEIPEKRKPGGNPEKNDRPEEPKL